jgi:NAD(P)H-nitrite reductase large subunit
MSVGGAQLMLKSAGMLPPAPIVIVGCGPLALLYAAQVQALGGAVSAFVQPAGACQPMAALEHGVDALRSAGYLLKGAHLMMQRALQPAKVYRNARDVRISGDEAVQGIGFNWRSKRVELPARTVLLHDGIVPQLQLTRLLEVEHCWHEHGHYQAPVTDPHGRSSAASVFVAGDGRQIDGAHAARHSGALAALAAVVDLQPHRQQHAHFQIKQHAVQLHRQTRVRPFLDALYPAAQWPFENVRDDTIVCRCENITAGAIQASCRAAVDSADRMKALHRCGMGPCQGRMCEYSVAMIAAHTLGCHPSEFGLHRIREPIKPISLGALASLAPAAAKGKQQC